MVARRELFGAQVRERLLRKEFDSTSVEDAIHRLRLTGAVDDRRAAGAYARHSTEIKSRGRRRILRELGKLGVNTNDAQQAVDDAYTGISEATLLSQVLRRRLTGLIETEAQFRRLYSTLLRQGFESCAIVALLKTKTTATIRPDEES